jgi:hypothetical protein
MRYFGEYKCGCVSKMTAKSEVLSYCEIHGADMCRIWRADGLLAYQKALKSVETIDRKEDER